MDLRTLLSLPSELFYVITAVVSLIQQRVKSDWWEVSLKARGGSRSTTMENGALCVITFGALKMPMWCAVSLVTLEPYLHLDEPPSAEAAVQSTISLCPALGARHTWWTAAIVTTVLEFPIAMVNMQE